MNLMIVIVYDNFMCGSRGWGGRWGWGSVEKCDCQGYFFLKNFTFYYVNLISLNFPGGPDPLDPHMTQHTNKSA